jgi:hypothetical protein
MRREALTALGMIDAKPTISRQEMRRRVLQLKGIA